MRKMILVMAAVVVSTLAIVAQRPTNEIRLEKKEVRMENRDGRHERRAERKDVYSPETKAKMSVDRIVSVVGELTTKEKESLYELCLTKEKERVTKKEVLVEERIQRKEEAKKSREKYEADVKAIIGDEKFAKLLEAKEARKAEKSDRRANNHKEMPRHMRNK